MGTYSLLQACTMYMYMYICTYSPCLPSNIHVHVHDVYTTFLIENIQIFGSARGGFHTFIKGATCIAHILSACIGNTISKNKYTP